ncbi:MAG: integrase [Nitrosopumilus sp.]|nr:integrase [Nitrosopumilus sp.]
MRKLTQMDIAVDCDAGRSAMDLFRLGIKSGETRKCYGRKLRQVLCHIIGDDVLQGDLDERAEQLVSIARENPGSAVNIMLGLSGLLRERAGLPKTHPEYLNPSSMPNFFKPVKKLLKMNGVTINWGVVESTYAEVCNVAESRGWSREEIRGMLRFATGAVDRAAVLIAASSAIRAGAFGIRWKDIRHVYKNGDDLSFEKGEGSEVACAMLTVYPGTRETYSAFITPEACKALDALRIAWAYDVGREPRPDDPVFKRAGTLPTAMAPHSVRNRISRMAGKAGYRIRDGKKQKRFVVPLMNGFRRFADKAYKKSLSKDSTIARAIMTEYMMGRRGFTSLDRNYFKAHPLELAREYLNAVPGLAIDGTERPRQGCPG